jgi:hypothetical protein
MTLACERKVESACTLILQSRSTKVLKEIAKALALYSFRAVCAHHGIYVSFGLVAQLSAVLIFAPIS